MTGRYAVGDLYDPDDDDKTFLSVEDAIDFAYGMALRNYHKSVAVWDLETNYVLHLFTAGEHFRPV